MSLKLDFRFRVGRTYRLTKWNAGDFSGTVEIRGELKPPDRYGNRVVLCNFRTDHGDFLGARGYVETAYAPKGEYLRFGKRSELLRMMGPNIYNTCCYAADEVKGVA